MTPKEKAKELLSIHSRAIKSKAVISNPVKYAAKECALICVDEILKSGCTIPSKNGYYGDNEEASKYYQEVKQEIEKL